MEIQKLAQPAAVWQRSIQEELAIIELLDQRISPLDKELTPIARANRDVDLLRVRLSRRNRRHLHLSLEFVNDPCERPAGWELPGRRSWPTPPAATMTASVR